jgi:SAM-dependent methyltransferase
MAGARGGAEGLFRSPPVPATPERLAWYVTHPATFSVKADGVSYEGPFPGAAYPALPKDVIDCGAWAAVRAEEMVVDTNQGLRTLYLVHDCMGRSFHTHTLCGRMGVLRRHHRLAPMATSHETDSAALDAFLRALPEDCPRCIWWPQWVGLLDMADPVGSLQLLAAAPITGYKNDGWVLTPHAEQRVLIDGRNRLPLDTTVKQSHDMTADLTVDGHVWRCAWEGNAWVPREARHEKRNPSPPEAVAILEAYHRCPWTPLDLAPYIQGAHYRPSHMGRLSKSTGAFLADRRRLQAERLADICAHGARVLDVGSGRGRVARLARTRGDAGPASWVGIDTDPVAVEDARHHPATQGHTWLWCDAATMAHPLTGERPPTLRNEGAFDVILLIHSVHHAASDEEVWWAWSQNLTALAARDCTLVIATVDPARLPTAPVELPDRSFVRPAESVVDTATASAICISLAWANSALSPVTEHYFSLERLTGDLGRLGWELTSLCRGPSARDWEAWADAHVWLVFRRA